MKNLIFILTLVFSFSSFAQIRFSVPEDKSRLKDLKNLKKNHLLILSSYQKQIDHQLLRLAKGIDYESNGLNHEKLKPLKTYFSELLTKRILVEELIKQLKNVDLDTLFKQNPDQLVFNTENIQLDLNFEIRRHANEILSHENYLSYNLEAFKDEILDEILKESAKKTFKALGNRLMSRILVSTLTKSALKTALINFGSKVFIEAGITTLVKALTFPLHAYRYTAEDYWLNILEDHPEFILNPDWMRYVGTQDHPWYAHAYAIIRKTNRMEEIFNKFLKLEEQEFQAEILEIYTSKNKYFVDRYQIQRDNTYYEQKTTHPKELPFWALPIN